MPHTRCVGHTLLHIPSLLVAVLLGFMLLTIELAFSLKRLSYRPELRTWTVGCWVMLAGFVTLAARPALPLWLSIIGGNWLICAGIGFYTQALRRMLGKPQATLGFYLPLALALPAIAAMVPWPLALRTSAMSALYVLMILPAIGLILRRGMRAEPSLRTVAAMLALAVGALVVRAVDSWMHPGQYTDLMQASLGQGLAFLGAFMAILGAGFGFVLAVFERVANQLEELATRDGLTGCLNRSTTDAMLLHELQRNRRLGTPLAFVLMDLDHFKSVNDRHGHRVGDAVLRQFAHTVRDRLRDSDVLGRTGGEEFALILPATDGPGALGLADQIRRVVESSWVTNERGLRVQFTVSAGIAVAQPGDDSTPEHMYGRADKALYAAKRAGRNRVELHAVQGNSVYAPLGPPIVAFDDSASPLTPPPRRAGGQGLR